MSFLVLPVSGSEASYTGQLRAFALALPAADHMHMDVVNDLPATAPDIDREAISWLDNRPCLCELFGRGEEFAQEQGVVVFHVVNRGNMFLGGKQDMSRATRIDVFEDNEVSVLVYDIGRVRFGNDLAKKA